MPYNNEAVIDARSSPKDWVMAVLKGYLDDSGDQYKPAMSVAGYVGNIAAWTKFEEGWQSALDLAEIPYFHMKEISDPCKPMHKFYGKENADANTRLLTNLVAAIGRASPSRQGFMAVGSVVSRDALARFNRERGRRLRSAVGSFSPVLH